MFTLSAPNNKRWRIYRDNKLYLDGVGSVTQAINIARLHGITLSKFERVNNLKAA